MRKNTLRLLLLSSAVLGLIAACGGVSAPASASTRTAQVSQTYSTPAEVRRDDAKTTSIVLNGAEITVDGDGAVVEGSRVTIVAAGTYDIRGQLDDGQIVVNSEDKESVELILDGASLNSSTTAPLMIEQADSVTIVLAEGTQNVISDGATYVFETADTDEPNAALFSKDDLTITGSGALSVTGHYNDGITSKDGLTINGGTLTVNAVDDGIRGKDYLIVTGGQITVNAQGDGLKSDNDSDTELGYITINGGTLTITAGGDAIQAQTDVTVEAGTFTLLSGGGSSARIDETLSAKGIKAGVSLVIDGGTFSIDAADDALHSNDSMVINSGTFSIASGDDGMHADTSLEVNAGDILISRSYEGLESARITINDGTFRVTASDDGLNVAGGNDGSGMMQMPGQGGRPNQGGGPGQGGGMGQGGGPGQGGGMGQGAAPDQSGAQGQGFAPDQAGGQDQGVAPTQGGGMNQDTFATSGDYALIINGGYLVIDAAGDGLDSNGSITMTGGVVLVNGPTEQMNGALDYQTGFTISGGYLVAVGSSGMAEAPGETSSQLSLLVNFNTTLPAGTLIHIQDAAGNDVLTFAPTKAYQSVAFSAPELASGATYTLYYGGSSNGMATDGLYQGGSYTPGTAYTDVTLSSVVTRIGQMGRW